MGTEALLHAIAGLAKIWNNDFAFWWLTLSILWLSLVSLAIDPASDAVTAPGSAEPAPSSQQPDSMESSPGPSDSEDSSSEELFPAAAVPKATSHHYHPNSQPRSPPHRWFNSRQILPSYHMQLSRVQAWIHINKRLLSSITIIGLTTALARYVVNHHHPDPRTWFRGWVKVNHHPNCQSIGFTPVRSPVIETITELHRSYITFPSADLFLVNMTVINGVPANPIGLERAVNEVVTLMRDVCKLQRLFRRQNEAEADAKLEALCNVSNDGFQSMMQETLFAVRHLEMLLDRFWDLHYFLLPNRYLEAIPGCDDDDRSGQNAKQYQECSLRLIRAITQRRWDDETRTSTLQQALFTTTGHPFRWTSDQVEEAEGWLRIITENIRTIRREVPVIEALVNKLSSQCEDVIDAKARIIDKGGKPKSGSWKRDKAMNWEQYDRELLRNVFAPVALSYINSAALAPFQLRMERAHARAVDYMLEVKALGEALDAMLNHTIPSVILDPTTKNLTVIGAPPADGVWVVADEEMSSDSAHCQYNVIYLPSVPDARKTVQRALKRAPGVINRIYTDIAEVKKQRPPSQGDSLFDFGDWDLDRVNFKRQQNEAHRRDWEEELKKGTRTFKIRGTSIPIRDFDNLLRESYESRLGSYGISQYDSRGAEDGSKRDQCDGEDGCARSDKLVGNSV